MELGIIFVATLHIENDATMIYYPNKSIKENAEANQCSEANVRKYIQYNNLDRRGDEQIRKYKRIHELRKKGLTLRAIALKEGVSVTTVRRYLDKQFVIDQHINVAKNSEYQRGKNTDCIKSVEDSQHKILRSILKLYIPSKTFDCDLTYSKGYFYKYRVPKPTHKFDKNPQPNDGEKVLPLEDARQLAPATLESVIIDLPFIIRDSNTGKSVIGKWYNSFRNVSDMESAYEGMMSLSNHILKEGGILIVKTQDVNSNGKQIWVHQIVERIAGELHFSIEDIFICVSSHVMTRADLSKQHHARKFHSYFYVLRKNS